MILVRGVRVRGKSLQCPTLPRSLSSRRPARAALVGALGVSWCMPWVLPALLVGGVGADPDGPAAFALADDSGLGTWVSALMGGGVWATGARLLEESMMQRPAYREYARRTSMFIPLPPRRSTAPPTLSP